MAYTERFADTFGNETGDVDITSHTPDTGGGTSWVASAGNAADATVDDTTETVNFPSATGNFQMNGFEASKGSAWAENQRAEATGLVDSGSFVHLAARVQDGATDVDGYVVLYTTGSWRLSRCDEGSTTLTAIDTAFDGGGVSGDVAVLTCESGTQDVSINAGEFTLSGTDSSFSGGSPGIIARRTLVADSPGLDNFKAYDEGAAAGSDVTGTFSNKFGNPQAGLSGLNWAFFDENIGALAAPTATGGVATSGLDGTFTIDVTGTSLTGGQTGTLVIYDSTGEKYGAYRAIIGANGTIRLDAPGLASSYYLDGQAATIEQILTPPMGPWR